MIANIIPEGRIFPVINEVLRSVTDDKTVHFHTLRKSGTFLAFALLRPQSVPIPKWLDNWPEQRKRILNGTKWHTRLVIPQSAAIDYTPSQYLCEFIKKCGYQGVIYRSSVSDGMNLALFEPTLATCNAVEQYRVVRVAVDIEPDRP